MPCSPKPISLTDTDAIAQLGLSRTLQDKLVDLEARERDLSASLEREKKTVARDPSLALNQPP